MVSGRSNAINLPGSEGRVRTVAPEAPGEDCALIVASQRVLESARDILDLTRDSK